MLRGLRRCYSWWVESSLPPDVARLLWDVDPEQIDLDRHRDYVMERVMSRGGWTSMCWLRQTYPLEEIGSFLVRKGSRLAPRELAYWALIADVDLPVSTGGARTAWSGP